MSGMELNKLMAAILVAGIVASLSGFIAREFIHPHELHEDAVPVEGVEGPVSGGGKQTMPEPILALIAEADIARGEKISRACAACHTFTEGGPNGTGPNLWNVVSRDKGSVGAFDYSDAMASAEGAWHYADLNHFLWKPRSYVPGTKMNYIGLKKPEDRAALIAWLRTLSNNPPPLPGAADIAAEKEALGGGEGEEGEEAAMQEGH